MSSTDLVDDPADAAADDPADDPPVRLIATGAAVSTTVAVAAAAYVALDAPAFGILVGAAMGAGTFLHLPFFLGVDAVPEDAWHDVHRGAVGLALEVGGVVAFALALVLDPGLQAVAGGLGVALIAALLLAAVLPDRIDEDETAA